MSRKIAVSRAPTLETQPPWNRQRRLLLLSPLLALPVAVAGAATPLATPPQMLGPFYPLRPDAAAGNDLTSVDGKGRAVGKPLRIVGRVTDTTGRALAGLLVEIWQTNAHGRYHHPQDDSAAPLDPNFRGYGRAVTGIDGAYRFTTIMPVAYPGRTPHVHFRLARGERELLVTQMYLPDAAGANARDGLFMSLREAARQRLVGVPERDSADTLRFDIVLE
ncbi:MAG: intradiol ring-cleavage dioxygenase [Rhodocyclales bacterium]|nr:intradiol ring-cleavage dioxygenase [Rhodocyclales bacterium]